MKLRWKSRTLKWTGFALLLVAVLGVAGCRTAAFYTQAIRGQMQIVREQRPIAEVIADPQTPAPLKAQLELVPKMRAFAETELKLPVDGHYQKYADLHRPFVVWNVQAAPPYSLEPKTWWYPFVGRLEYRGYFNKQSAQKTAQQLAAKGYDVSLEGVAAYSTLGWFKDPILNTFVDEPEPGFAEILFHELGHQRVFASGDTDFNEAFATVVGQEGARRWLALRGNTNLHTQYELGLERNDQFVHLIMNTRERLMGIYGDTLDKEGKVKAARQLPASADQLNHAKQEAVTELRQRYAKLKEEWGGWRGYDNWFARDLNNAWLNTVANYFDLVPGFERLLELNHGDLEKFYKAAEHLAKRPQDERREFLRSLAAEKRPSRGGVASR